MSRKAKMFVLCQVRQGLRGMEALSEDPIARDGRADCSMIQIRCSGFRRFAEAVERRLPRQVSRVSTSVPQTPTVHC
jgi:hypothetical protein